MHTYLIDIINGVYLDTLLASKFPAGTYFARWQHGSLYVTLSLPSNYPTPSPERLSEVTGHPVELIRLRVLKRF